METLSRTLTIRAGTTGDRADIEQLLLAAFPGVQEAQLVRALWDTNQLFDLAAIAGDQLLGYVAFSPVYVDGADCGGLGLAPLAVHPTVQRQGIGSALVTAGLAAASLNRFRYVVVLGEPAFYQRFGFTPAAAAGLGNVYGAEDEFRVRSLRQESLPAPGLVTYCSAFDRF